MQRRNGAVSKRLEDWPLGIVSPRPGVSEPKLRQYVNHGLFWAAVTNRDQHQNVFRRGLGVFDKDVKISVFIESIRVDQLKFCIVLAPPSIFFRQPGVRKLP